MVEPTASPSFIVTPTGTQTVSGKVDLLLMVDDSGSMGDKQELLKKSLPALVRRLVSPNCVDASGTVIAPSNNGFCATGHLEFAPVNDLHVGIVTSSLGTPGSDTCVQPLVDRKAHLVTTGPGGVPVANASAGFLSFGAGGVADPTQLIDDVTALVGGVGTRGCGLEAQLEAWYRFLVEPNPYDSVTVDADGVAHREGTDETVLKQRHDFLRPDSLLSIVVVTDEDDSTVDPVSLGGRGWGFANISFPGSNAPQNGGRGTAPRATSACAANPGAPECTSCGFAAACANGSGPSADLCAVVENDPICSTTPYYADRDDSPDARFFQMKRRFGVDPQFPLDRYVQGLLSAKVPSREDDHDADGRYTPTPSCDNPIFAPALPTSADQELCHLTAGPRSQRLVVLSVMAGAPPDLLHPNMTAGDWARVVGTDPAGYVLSGIDPHMLQSIDPRPGLPGPSSANDADPVHGREWVTQGELQYACTFALDAPRDCTTVIPDDCDCRLGTNAASPICDATVHTLQVAAKAYPGVRPLRLAQLLGDNAVASSICPSPTTGPVTVPGGNGPTTGYGEAFRRLGNRMAMSLLPAPTGL
ncbi:hypothetical protein AKJ09_09028 [Labilithrix luteola]|uniref:VWA domain-containing protein n=1 Tax=Labilithrix luteola TaxID=1391654 RepID=A0A0K1QAC5_9BACT|nr:hypothetical protein AKJ09_09028 [Labilithrix luteola]